MNGFGRFLRRLAHHGTQSNWRSSRGGRLRRVRGKGTFVALTHWSHACTWRLFPMRWARKMSLRAHGFCFPAGPQHRLMSISSFKPKKVLRIHLRRLRLGDGEPYSIDDGWYNSNWRQLCSRMTFITPSIQFLENDFDLPISGADQTVTAVAADEEVASLLDVTPGAPLLHIIRYSSSGDKPVEWCSSVYRTDRYRLSTRIARALEF